MAAVETARLLYLTSQPPKGFKILETTFGFPRPNDSNIQNLLIQIVFNCV
jgi:hypothetical protein